MTPALALDGIRLRLGAFALRGIDLAVRPGEVLVILGRNGAGKSVTLETIAGFHRPSAGQVLINGRNVTHLPPEARRVAFALQNFGLFPHLTAAGNVASGIRRTACRERRERARMVEELLARFGVAGIATRVPAELSPGEKQRVALARAMASAPDVFLFDEPFSAIDAPTRTGLRRELRAFLRHGKLPAVFVTHDLADAWALADTVAIMQDGAVIQAGPLEEISCRPATRGIAELLGFENLLPGEITDTMNGICRVTVGGSHLTAAHDGQQAGAMLLCLRAGDVSLSRPDQELPHANRLTGRIVAIENHRQFLRVELDCGFPLIAALGRQEACRQNLAPGATATAWIRPEAIHVIPAG